jgi:hypothetical protein
MTPIVIYRGPSQIDGKPIVCLATVGSKNVKTGSMVQTWILRSDLPPFTISNTGQDGSICGKCPRRHSLGGDCYVIVHNAPTSTWRNWHNAGQPGENWADPINILRLQSDARESGLRLGSYGDPAAVPIDTWQDLIDAIQPKHVVGYTHQWRNLSSFSWRDVWFRDHVMASCDSIDDAKDASRLGWRFFLAVPETLNPSLTLNTVVQCPATISDRTCATCGACHGSGRGSTKASIYVVEHGVRSMSKNKRLHLTVVQ